MSKILIPELRRCDYAACQFSYCFSLFAAYTRESLEELIQGTGFRIIKKSLYSYSGAAEYGCASQYFLVYLNYVLIHKGFAVILQ